MVSGESDDIDAAKVDAAAAAGVHWQSIRWRGKGVSTTSYMGLSLIGWFEVEHSGEGKKPIMYSVSGLTPDDYCIVSFAGLGWDGKDTWRLVWFRSGKQLATPDESYDSPEDALKVAAELKEKGI